MNLPKNIVRMIKVNEHEPTQSKGSVNHAHLPIIQEGGLHFDFKFPCEIEENGAIGFSKLER